MLKKPFLDQEQWGQLLLALPKVLKKCPSPPAFEAPDNAQDAGNEEEEDDEGEDEDDVALRGDLTAKLFFEGAAEEAMPISQVAANCQEHVFQVDKKHIDLGPVFAFVLQQAKRKFPKSHLQEYDTDTKLWREETNIVVQYLKSLIELVRALRPEPLDLEEEEESDDEVAPSDDGSEADGKAAKGDEEEDPPWAPPVNVDKEDFRDAQPRLKKFGFPIEDPDLLWEELAVADKKGKVKKKAKAKDGEGDGGEEEADKKKQKKKVLSLAALVHWAAIHGYPEVVMPEEEDQEEKPKTIFDLALVVREHSDYLWSANSEGALIECMLADEPNPQLVETLLRKPKVDVNAKDDSFGFTGCHFAARLGDTVLLSLIMDKKANLVPCKMGNTPLHLAAKGGYDAFVKLLMTKKARLEDKNKNGWTPMTWACAYGHVEVVKTLLDAKAKLGIEDADGRTEAMWAAKHGHAEVLRLLLEAGFDFNKTDKYGLAVADHAQDHLDLRRSFLQAEQQNRALLQAAQRGSKEGVKQALKDGAYVDAKDEQGWTALVWSMMNASVELVTVLAQHSADPGVLNECSEVLDHLKLAGDKVRQALDSALAGGLGAGDRLLTAARNNSSKAVVAELDVGAQVNSQTKDQRHSALIFAVAHCNYEAARALINRKANVELADFTGWSPAHYAVQSGELKMVSYLYAMKADLNRATNDGTTMVHLAARANHGPMVQLLVAAKCNLNVKNARAIYPIQEAARSGCAQSLQALISFKAKLDVKEPKQRSLLSLAVASGRDGVVSALMEPLPLPEEVLTPEQEQVVAEKNNKGKDESLKLLGRACQMRAKFVESHYARIRARERAAAAARAAQEEAEAAAAETAAMMMGAGVEEEPQEAAQEAVEEEPENELIPAGGHGQLEQKDSQGRLPIHLAAISKRASTIALLLAHQAQADAKDDQGNTALMFAASRGDQWTVDSF